MSLLPLRSKALRLRAVGLIVPQHFLKRDQLQVSLAGLKSVFKWRALSIRQTCPQFGRLRMNCSPCSEYFFSKILSGHSCSCSSVRSLQGNLWCSLSGLHLSLSKKRYSFRMLSRPTQPWCRRKRSFWRSLMSLLCRIFPLPDWLWGLLGLRGSLSGSVRESNLLYF